VRGIDPLAPRMLSAYKREPDVVIKREAKAKAKAKAGAKAKAKAKCR